MWLGFVHPPHGCPSTKRLTATRAPGAGGCGAGACSAESGAGSAAVSLKHPAISKGPSVAAFAVFRFPATPYTADLQPS